MSVLHAKVSKLNKKRMSEKLKESRTISVLQKLLPNQRESVFHQIRSRECKPRGMRWSARFISISSAIYHRSPSCYNFLRNNLKIALPSVSVLKRSCRRVMLNTGVCPIICNILKHKVDTMNAANRTATLAIDGASISSSLRYVDHIDRIVGFEDVGRSGCTTKISDECVVTMLRGIQGNWKQVFSYYFIRHSVKVNRFADIINENLAAAHAVGIKVIAIVCDQETTQWSFINKSVTFEKPYISHPVTQEPVYFILDIPHCLKNLRNSLLKNDIQFEATMTAKFDHLLLLWKSQRNSTLTLTTKLRDEHFILPFGRKMKVSLAAQLFSHSVHSAMEVLIHYKELPLEARETSTFVKRINDLFDRLNTVSKNHLGPRKAACSQNIHDYLSSLERDLNWISEWKVISKKDGKVKYSTKNIQAWKISISSILHMTKKLILEENFDQVAARRLTQDHVENLFSCVRSRGCFNTHPECRDFQAALRSTAINSLIFPTRGPIAKWMTIHVSCHNL